MRRGNPGRRDANWLVGCSMALAAASACGGQSSAGGGAAGGSGGRPSTAGAAGTPVVGSGATGPGGAPVVGGGAGGPGGASMGGSILGGAAGAANAGTAGGGASAGGDNEAGAAGAAPCDEVSGCAPHDGALVFAYDSKSCPSDALSATSTASYFIGGINRLVLELRWACSDFGAWGGPSRAELELRLTDPSTPPLGEVEQTFTLPPPAGVPSQYFFGQSDVWIRGSGVPEVQSKLAHVQSEVSVRRAGGFLTGAVRYVGTSDSGARVVLRAPFEVAEPKP